MTFPTNYKFSPSNYQKSAQTLLSKMTLQEKIGQLCLYGSLKPKHLDRLKQGLVGGLLNVYGASQVNDLQRIAVEQTRLGIPLIIGDDVIHGFKTIFPIPLASAASFDMEAIERAELTAAREAYACGINWIYAPMVDITRDPRWGRVAEGAGEDPYLGGCVAKARVAGLQSVNPDTGYPYVAACPKHFAGYGLSEGGRDYDSGDISEHTLYSTYLPTYKAAVEAGAMSIMSSFNTLNADPASGSKHLLTDVLRGEMGFEGMVVSDWESIMELIFHRTAKDQKDAARSAILAGNDMDMHSGCYEQYLEELVNEDQSNHIQECIDRSVSRILTVKYALGLFDNPYRSFEGEQIILSDEHRAAARDVAKRSMVLLKNDKNALPISRKTKIFLTGPLANEAQDMLGMWSCKGNKWDVVTLKSALPNATYLRGCEIGHDCHCDFEQATKLAANADVIVYACGEPEWFTGENRNKTDISLPKIQSEYAKHLKSIGKPLISVVMVGRPVAMVELDSYSDAVLLAWHSGVEAGNAICDCLFGDYAPSGRLPITFPRSTGQIPTYYSRLSSGRPYNDFPRYLDCDVTPLYPFGYGLTYSPIHYSDFTIKNPILSDGETLNLTVNLTNKGSIDTEEVVQLYFKDVVSSVATPERKLCAFKKVMVRSGQTVAVEFEVESSAFTFLDKSHTPTLEAGEFNLYIGSDSNCEYCQTFAVR